MRIDRFQTLLLLVIALSLAALAVRPYMAPPAVNAQLSQTHSVYIEPGTFMLRQPDGSRQVLGRVVVDLRNGNIWGFPTMTIDPYPSNLMQTTPPTSHPFLLGTFALSDMDK
jgi:hypothetical protein